MAYLMSLSTVAHYIMLLSGACDCDNVIMTLK